MINSVLFAHKITEGEKRRMTKQQEIVETKSEQKDGSVCRNKSSLLYSFLFVNRYIHSNINHRIKRDIHRRWHYPSIVSCILVLKDFRSEFSPRMSKDEMEIFRKVKQK